MRARARLYAGPQGRASEQARRAVGLPRRHRHAGGARPRHLRAGRLRARFRARAFPASAFARRDAGGARRLRTGGADVLLCRAARRQAGGDLADGARQDRQERGRGISGARRGQRRPRALAYRVPAEGRIHVCGQRTRASRQPDQLRHDRERRQRLRREGGGQISGRQRDRRALRSEGAIELGADRRRGAGATWFILVAAVVVFALAAALLGVFG